jgi:glucose/arabinose dehydrogenase
VRLLFAALLLSLSVPLAQAAEPDDLILPPGFHASVVAEALGPARHLAIRTNGDIYISTRVKRGDQPVGIIALKLGSDGKVLDKKHFSTIDGGTGVRIYGNWLYAASSTSVYRFKFYPGELVPSDQQMAIDGMPGSGFPSRGLAFDNKGGLYVTVGASSNICLDPNAQNDALVGLRPCPSLTGRSGVWRFDSNKLNQKFPADGEQIATGLRDMMAVDWSRDFDGFYGVMQGRNDHIDTVSEEMHRIVKGANLGWPYTYYDTARHERIVAKEYGGDGDLVAQGDYDVPILALPAHQSPLDLVFYKGQQFPVTYRGGAFIVFHGGAGQVLPHGHRGYDIEFVPFDHSGKPGLPRPFIEGFAGPQPSDRNPAKAAYRPTGAAVAPDGSLYVVDGKVGRLWHITYTGKN